MNTQFSGPQLAPIKENALMNSRPVVNLGEFQAHLDPNTQEPQFALTLARDS